MFLALYTVVAKKSDGQKTCDHETVRYSASRGKTDFIHFSSVSLDHVCGLNWFGWYARRTVSKKTQITLELPPVEMAFDGSIHDVDITEIVS